MADKKKGYVPIWRSIKDNWIWKMDEPFDYRSAWIDLLLSANHEEKKIYIDGRIQVIKRGQLWTSIVKLGRTWGWSRSRVYRYIDLLKSDGMILTDGTASGTLITLVNYGSFALSRNASDTSNDTSDETTPDTSGDTTGDTQTITIDNVNNSDNGEKDIPAPPVALPSGGGEWQ